MLQRVNYSQWRDRTEEPAIVWVPLGAYIAEPVAMDDTNGNDLYDELTRAWFAACAYQTAEELEANAGWYDLTPAQMWALYEAGNGSEEAAGLPRQYYAEGCNKDGSDAIIYVDEETERNTHRETLEEATPYLDPKDIEEIRRKILAAREEYAR